MNTIRYVLEKDVRFIYDTEQLSGKTFIPYFQSDIFVDILQRKENSIQLKLYFPNGDIKIGWVISLNVYPSIKINNMDLLFDGRFNA